MQNDLLRKIYKKHQTISWIVKFEIWPSLDDSCWIVRFTPCNVKTELLWWCGRWMEQGLLLNYARSSSNLELPLMTFTLTVHDLACKWWFLASIPLNYAHGSWIDEEQCYVYADFWRKSERESEEVFVIFRSRSEFCYG